MYGLRVRLRPDSYIYQLHWTLRYRKYITTLSAATIDIHMIPLYSLVRLQRIRLTRTQVHASDAARLLNRLPNLKHVHVSKIVATNVDTTFDMTELSPSLESVSLVVDMPRLYVDVHPNWKHLHIQSFTDDGIITIMNLGQLQSVFIYGSVILANCTRCHTLQRVWFESPDMLLYHHLLDCIPKTLESLTVHCPRSFLLWNTDIRAKYLRLSGRTVFIQQCHLPTASLVIFAKLLMSSREVDLPRYQPKTIIAQEHIIVM